MNYQILEFYRGLIRPSSLCLLVFQLSFKYVSYLKKKIDGVFRDKYQIRGISDKDSAVVIATSFYVQYHEESRCLFGV